MAILFFGLFMGGGAGLGLIAQAQPGAVPSMTSNATTAVSSGGLSIVYDSLNCVPSGHFMSFGIPDASSPEVSPLIQFPVRSPGLAPGRLAGSPVFTSAHWLVQPLFLVGEDTRSTAWLKANRQALSALGATGMVVQVSSAREFKRLQLLGDGLPMAPASSPWLTERLQALGAAVLPLLILADGRITQAPTRPAPATPIAPAPGGQR